MPNPTYSQVHVNVPLTNLTVAYLQPAEAFVANSCFPRVPVPKKSDLYFTFDRAYWLKNFARKRAIGDQAPRSGYGIATSSYEVEREAIAHAIPDPLRENADNPLDLDMQATQFIGQQMLLTQEIDFAAKYFAGSIWDNNPTTTVQWDDPTSTPIEDIRKQKRTILQNTGFEPNTGVFGKSTFDRLCDHPDIVDRIKYGQTAGKPAMANEQTLAQLLGLDRILVARAVQNTAGEAKTGSYSFVASATAALIVYAAPAPGLMIPSAGYKFVWQGAGNDMGVQVKRYRDEPKESEVIEGQIWYKHAIIGAALGCFFNSAVAS